MGVAIPASVRCRAGRLRLSEHGGGYGGRAYISRSRDRGHVLVAPEPGPPTAPRRKTEVYVVLEGSGVLRSKNRDAARGEGRRSSSPPEPSTGSPRTSTSRCSLSSTVSTAQRRRRDPSQRYVAEYYCECKYELQQCHETSKRARTPHYDDPVAVGKRLYDAREGGLSQRELAFPAAVPRTYLAQSPAVAERIPSLQVMRELARRMGVSEARLAFGRETLNQAVAEPRDAETAEASGDRGTDEGLSVAVAHCSQGRPHARLARFVLP